MKRFVFASLLAISAIALTVLPVLAIEPPVSTDMHSVRVFQNLAEPGDMLVVFHWEWDYSDNYSATPASESIIYRLYDTDGTTLLGTGTPYVFSLIGTNGYGNNVGSIYFNAADNITWGLGYKLNIYGVPAFFDDPPSQNHILTTDEYCDEESQEDNRSEMYNYILTLCDYFDNLFDINLKTSSDSGIVLSSYGELFFVGAIPGLQALCPQLFFMQVYVPEVMPVEEYDTSLLDIYTNRLADTDLGRGLERLGDLVIGEDEGTHRGIGAAVIYFPLAIGLCIWTIRRNWGLEIGLGGCAVIGICGALIVGDWVFTLLMIGSLGAAGGIFYLTTFKRS